MVRLGQSPALQTFFHMANPRLTKDLSLSSLFSLSLSLPRAPSRVPAIISGLRMLYIRVFICFFLIPFSYNSIDVLSLWT